MTQSSQPAGTVTITITPPAWDTASHCAPPPRTRNRRAGRPAVFVLFCYNERSSYLPRLPLLTRLVVTSCVLTSVVSHCRREGTVVSLVARFATAVAVQLAVPLEVVHVRSGAVLSLVAAPVLSLVHDLVSLWLDLDFNHVKGEKYSCKGPE